MTKKANVGAYSGKFMAEYDKLPPLPEATVRYIRAVGTAMITKDMTGLNLSERRAVARHLLVADGYPTRVVGMLTQWFPAQILREHGFTGKAR